MSISLVYILLLKFNACVRAITLCYSHLPAENRVVDLKRSQIPNFNYALVKIDGLPIFWNEEAMVQSMSVYECT